MKTPADRLLALETARRSADNYGNHAIDEFLAGRLSRRELLRHASIIGLSLAGGGLFATPQARAQGTAGAANATIRVAHLTPAGAIDPLTVTDASCSLSRRSRCHGSRTTRATSGPSSCVRT
jgi:peptide/nickel transport system substrate-binding protein